VSVRWLSVFLGAFFLLPVAVALAMNSLSRDHSLSLWQMRSDSSRQAPDPASFTPAVVQVYSARAARWRGALGVHTWLAVKPRAASHYTRYEVFGWGVQRGRPALLIREGLTPDGYWFGSRPDLLVDLRGAQAEVAIEKIRAAAARYPHHHEYTLWPGPNSNTFTAYIGRAVPELRLDLPPTAIGKDYLAGGGFFARSPSGTGFQLSAYGLLGLLVGLEEGLEINILGLSVGIDILRPALKLPGIGRLGFGAT
jgi:hypothetical protein